jgi:hypothetical protein
VLTAGDIVSFAELCIAEGKMMQQGMHFRSGGNRHSVILMSRQKGGKYPDGIAEDGKTILYVGHDAPGDREKKLDQPLARNTGNLTENGKFFQAAEGARQGLRPERVRVYEKLKPGIWVFNGLFALTGARMEVIADRRVWIFELAHSGDERSRPGLESAVEESFGRLIPTEVKLKVWQRDKARCVMCGSSSDLHFDHIIPFSMGGSSLDAKNVQLLCRTCNLRKSDAIV